MAKDNEFLRGKPKDGQDEALRNLVVKIIVILMTFIGIWIATQRFAYLMGYHPDWVGYPLYVIKIGEVFTFPLYNPFLIFYWMLMYYRRTDIHDYFFSAVKVSGFVWGFSITFYFIFEFIIKRKLSQNLFGTARWANVKDLKKDSLLLGKGGMVIGQTFNAKIYAENGVFHSIKPSKIITQPMISNMALAAQTRSGKGISCVIPTCFSYPGSLIVLDFKGELFNVTSGYRSKFSKVFRWDPTGDKGHHFNPMMEIRPGENAFSDANLQADILTTPKEGGGNATSEHFQTGAKEILTGVILHCLCSDWKDKSLSGCRKFLAQSDPTDPNNKNYIWDLMIHADHGDEMIHQAVVECATNQRNRGADEGASMLSTVNNALSVFADEKIKRNSFNSEFFIDEFAETKVPITLYLTIQYSDVARIGALIRMFIILFARKFTSGETSATNRKFNIPLLFILDEFDKLGRMDELEMNMGIHNGFGIHYFLIFQSLNQINKIYTKEHSILAHCRNQIYYAPSPQEMDSAEMISKICGKESISRTSISYSGGKSSVGYGQRSLSDQEQERSLINADEVIKLPLDQFILISQGRPPYIGKKIVYYEDPLFKKKAKLPPAFTTREEAIKIAEKTVKKLNKRRWFDRSGSIQQSYDMPEEDVAAMWDKVGDLYNDMPEDFSQIPEEIINDDEIDENDSSNNNSNNYL